MRGVFKRVFILALASVASYGVRAQTLTDVDVGTPSQAGSMTVSNDASGGKVYTIVGGGSDIWGGSDNFHYAYTKVTGDFDYVMKVESLIGNSGDGGWSKVELMARQEETDGAGPQGNDPMIANMTTRSNSDTANSAPAGVNYLGPQWRVNRGGNADWRTPSPVVNPSIPNNWVRLERVGTAFYMYYSTDGKTWSVYQPYSPQGFNTAGMFPAGADNATAFPGSNAAGGTDTAPWPNTIFLGIAVTAHNDGDISTAVISNFKPYTPVPIAITQQPAASLSVMASQPLTLSVAATGDPVHYQWMKDGTSVGTNGVSATYTIPISKVSDAGSYTVKVFGGGKEIVSSASVVTVTVDTTPPTVFGATGSPTFDHVTVSFAEPVDPATATNVANYSISPSLAITSATLANNTNVVFATAKQPSATAYTLTVNNVKDLSGNVIAANTKVNFSSFTWVNGFFAYKIYDTVTALATLKSSVDTLIPSRVLLFNSADTLAWEYGDNYTSLSEGLITAPETGDYTFHIASDDAGQLFLSTDDSVANLGTDPICQVTGWDGHLDWDSSDYSGNDQNPQTGILSIPITLTKGKQYYYRVFHAEGGGGDGTSIGWERPSAVGTINVIPGADLSVAVNANNSTVTISQQPQAVITVQNTTATFKVVATGLSDLGTNVTYQWQKNGTDIAGATSASYTTPLLTLADTGTKFKCNVGVPAKTVSSDEVTLTVNVDNIPPTIASVVGGASMDRVIVTFSELVDPATATNTANYVITPSLSITGAVLQGITNGLPVSAVVLATPQQPQGSSYTITVSGVKDLVGNVLAAGSQKTFTAVTLVPGTFVWQIYDNAGFSSSAASLTQLENTFKDLVPTRVLTFPTADTPAWEYGDNFGSVAQGMIQAPESGNYIFHIASDDMSQLFLSTDDSPANLSAQPICQVTGWDNQMDWTSSANTGNDLNPGTGILSNPINLVKGKNYYFRAFEVEGGGGDGISLGWELPSATGTIQLIPGTALLTAAPAASPVNPQLAVKQQNGQVVITWAAGTLVSSPTVKGTYAPVTGATSPFTVTPTANSTMFYQVQQ